MEQNQTGGNSKPTVPMSPKRKKDNLSIPMAIVLSGVLIAAAILFTDQPVPQKLAVAQTITAKQKGADITGAPLELLTLKADDHILGNPKSDVVIIEYTDAQCPFCARFHQTMLKVMQNYGKGGQVAWVYRHFPLDQIHPYARKAAEALECGAEIAGNQGFWKLEDKVFSADTKSIAEANLPKLAASVGIDEAKFTTCLSSGKWATRVQRDFEEGVSVGVKGTPYSIIWNRKTGKQIPINGAYPYDNVKSILGLVAASAQNPN